MKNETLEQKTGVSESAKMFKEEKPYKGLVLMEEKSYSGPTSIKYWM